MQEVSSTNPEECGSTNPEECGQQPPPKKRRRFSHYPEPIDVLQGNCCIDECLQYLSPKDIELAQFTMKNKRENEQLNFIIREISNHTIILANAKNLLDNIYNFTVGGKRVCKDAWCAAHNVSNSRFRKAVKSVKKGHTKLRHGNRGRKKLTVKSTNAIGWMRHTFERVGMYKK